MKYSSNVHKTAKPQHEFLPKQYLYVKILFILSYVNEITLRTSGSFVFVEEIFMKNI